jgi:hypothetical protein
MLSFIHALNKAVADFHVTENLVLFQATRTSTRSKNGQLRLFRVVICDYPG